MPRVALLSGVAGSDPVAEWSSQLTSNGDTKIRLSAAVALGNARDVRGIDALATALRRDLSPFVRATAALALGRDGFVEKADAKTRNYVVVLLKASSEQDPDERVRLRSRASYERTLALYTPSEPPPAQMPPLVIEVSSPSRSPRMSVGPVIVGGLAGVLGLIATLAILGSD